MAGNASFRLHRSVLEDKRSGFIGVASEADLILGCGSAELTSKESAVRVVTIAAADQSFIHTMVKGLGELRLYLGMAAVAEHGLRHREERTFHLGMMSRMAVDTADVVLKVL